MVIASSFAKGPDGVVVLAFQPQPLDFISKAAKLCGPDAVMDPDVARMAGANLAAGTPAVLAALRTRLEAGAIAASEKETRGLALPAGAVEWLAAGERGTSSNTMFAVLTGIEAARDGHRGHPRDSADLRRCRLLLEAVPALAERLALMRNESPEWAALAAAWEEICRVMDDETPDWRDPNCNGVASRTYELIKKANGR